MTYRMLRTHQIAGRHQQNGSARALNDLGVIYLQNGRLNDGTIKLANCVANRSVAAHIHV